MKFRKRAAALLSAAAMLFCQAGLMPTSAPAVAADDTQDDWLHVEGDKIVDMNGNEVWLTGVNWFGYNVGSQVFDGVWSANMHDCLRLIADHGFNLLRVPMSTEIILQWKNKEPDPIIKVNATTNPELVEQFDENGTPIKYKYSFDIWNMAVQWCKELGIKIMIDIHSAETHAAGHNFALWYNDKFSTDDWIEAMTWLTEYYKDDDTLIAMDLKNEPHGKTDEPQFAKWDDSTDLNNWKYAAEKAANAILDINPHMLIMVEGIEVYPKEDATWESLGSDYSKPPYPYSNFYGAWWGANFRGVKEHPIDLGNRQSQLVYSPHDYGPEVWKQEWFYLEDKSKTFSRETLLDDYWRDTWAFIAEDHIAPLLMGEWGGWVDDEHDKTGENRHWLQEIRDYMIDMHIHHTFWCFNENSSDTGGLVYDNFGKWDDVKYEFIKPALWQDENGVFISLDHKYPMGANGQSLSEYYGGGHKITTKPTVTTTTTTTSKTTTSTTTTTTSTVTTTTVSSVTTTTLPTTDYDTMTTVIQPDVKYGDLNCDSVVDIRDAVLLARIVGGDSTASVTDAGKRNADLDGSGKVEAPDLVLLLRFLAKLIGESDLGKAAA